MHPYCLTEFSVGVRQSTVRNLLETTFEETSDWTMGNVMRHCVCLQRISIRNTLSVRHGASFCGTIS